MTTEQTGHIGWHDLTVEDATGVRDFYCAVAGWTAGAVSMGDYDDYTLHDAAGNAVAGVCHARGCNAGLPPQWLMYVTIADLDQSLDACKRLGGELVDGPRTMGKDRMCVVRDPAGAVLALYEKGSD